VKDWQERGGKENVPNLAGGHQGVDEGGAADVDALPEPGHVQIQVLDHAGAPDAEGGGVCPLVDLGLA